MRIPDRVTKLLRSQADEWHDIVGLSDQRVAGRIRDDRIDILVDPTLHTADNRIRVLARKPAPVQVTMLGPPTTTGLTTVDYRLTDAYLDPPGASDADYSEQSIRLPHCFWIYRPPDEAPPVGTLPVLKNGFVAFGCLNQFAKVTRPALHLWMKILQCVPELRLVLQSPPGSHQEALRRLFAEGVSRASASSSSPGPLEPRISSSITTWICASTRSPTTAIPARSMRSGWEYR